MSILSQPPSGGLSCCTYLINTYVCDVIHNPINSSLIIISAVFFVAYNSFIHWIPFRYTDDSAYSADLLHNLVNLAFILRFPLTSKTKLGISSNKPIEVALFLCLNAMAVSSLYSSFLHVAVMNRAFKLLLWASTICPYVILMLNFMEYFQEKSSSAVVESSSEKITRPKTRESVLSILIDANNSFLAIFIAQSFALINMKLPFPENGYLGAIYKYSSYSMKFYLIYCFVLYEIVVVIHEFDDIKSYSEMYRPVQLGKRRKLWQEKHDGVAPFFLLAATFILMAFDVSMLVFKKFM